MKLENYGKHLQVVAKTIESGCGYTSAKKGDRKNPNNYRGVCLLPILSRILARILATRLRNWAKYIGELYENQAGFRQAWSTADAIQILYAYRRTQNSYNYLTRITTMTVKKAELKRFY